MCLLMLTMWKPYISLLSATFHNTYIVLLAESRLYSKARFSVLGRHIL